MINEALKISLKDAQIEKILRQAIKDANIAMISKDDIEIIAHNILEELRAVSLPGPKKGENAPKKEEPEEESESEEDVKKTPAKKDDIENIEHIIGQMWTNYQVCLNKSNGSEMRRQAYKDFLNYEDEGYKLLSSVEFADNKYQEEYDKLSVAMSKILHRSRPVKESLNLSISDDQLGEVVFNAIKNAAVSDFLRLSGNEIVRIAEQVQKAFRKMDKNFEADQRKDEPEPQENSSERELQAAMQEELKKDEDGNTINDDAGDVEFGINAFNSSFGEELNDQLDEKYSTMDALFILNRTEEK